MKAAYANKLQRSDTIVLGATLATIGLTVPLKLAVFLHRKQIGIGPGQCRDLPLERDLLISVINASAGRTNILQGVIHLTLFAAFLVVIFV